MSIVKSPDGTSIAYESTGSGPALVLVDGAMCHRAGGPMRPLAEALRDRFTVYTYDRRGRGESGDTPPYAVAREVEDLQAVIAAAGGDAGVYAVSSGGGLALATAVAGPGVARLAMYEPPYMAEIGDDGPVEAYTRELAELLAAGRRGDAVALFMKRVGMPEPMIDGMRAQPSWSAFEAIAPTLAYDDAVLSGGRVPRDVAATVSARVVVLNGGASPPPLQQAAKATAAALPTAELRTLDGQTHDAAPDAVAPVLAEFFAG
ncbi:MAG TPA: alpha/beta hydrolase [Nocardioidaceae bacterium]|nr:alpha/beta hydrolase [Nocardioidaceae bacterium]